MNMKHPSRFFAHFTNKDCNSAGQSLNLEPELEGKKSVGHISPYSEMTPHSH